MNKKLSKKIIEKMGGPVAVARFFGITKGAVSQWKTNGIPDARERHLKDIKPDLFASNRGTRKAA